MLTIKNMTKKTIFLLTVVVFSGAPLFAFGLTDASSVVAHGAGLTWETDFEAAKAKAKASGKPMLLDFTGSDWCGWCIRLDKEVFSRPEFAAFASKALVLVELDFPRGKSQPEAVKKQNEALAKQYGVQGFPTIVLLSPEGKLLAETGYQRGGAAKYVAHLKELLAGKL
jgi:thioredoxin-related protein